jgi:hypothetical protein
MTCPKIVRSKMPILPKVIPPSQQPTQEQSNPTHASPNCPDLNPALWWSTTRPVAPTARPSTSETRPPAPETPAPDPEVRPTAPTDPPSTPRAQPAPPRLPQRSEQPHPPETPHQNLLESPAPLVRESGDALRRPPAHTERRSRPTPPLQARTGPNPCQPEDPSSLHQGRTA